MLHRHGPSSPRSARQPDRRAALLAALRAADGPIGVEAAAAAIGTTESTARFHLSLLVSAGQAVRTPHRSGSAGRPSWRYAPARPQAASESYLDLARALAARLDEEASAAEEARRAGRRWAETLPPADVRPAAGPADAVAGIADVLGGLGFAPDVRAAGTEIVLHACPFETVAREHRAVVCGVHLGLLERTAATIGGGIVVDGLEPFRTEQPLTCAVRLRHTS